MEYENKLRRNFLSLSKLECSPQEINSREICQPALQPTHALVFMYTEGLERLRRSQKFACITYLQRIGINATKFETR